VLDLDLGVHREAVAEAVPEEDDEAVEVGFLEVAVGGVGIEVVVVQLAPLVPPCPSRSTTSTVASSCSSAICTRCCVPLTPDSTASSRVRRACSSFAWASTSARRAATSADSAATGSAAAPSAAPRTMAQSALLCDRARVGARSTVDRRAIGEVREAGRTGA
jgi:hypothetical protein